MKGAALILQKHSNAAQFCSSVRGRNLFKWYTLIEDECCLLLCCRSALPKTWRYEDLRIRRVHTAADSSQESEDQLKSRRLDDALQATLAIIPTMADVLATIPELKRSTGEMRLKMIAELEFKLIYIVDYLESLRTSALIVQLLQIVEFGFPWRSRHSTCCPELPFPSFSFLYPPAGMLSLALLALRNYVQVVLYAPVQAEGVRIDKVELNSKFEEHNAYEMCRAYAAIEDEFSDDVTRLLPCFRPLTVAAFSCPTEQKRWLWHKLAHLEKLAHEYVEPVTRHLSVVWATPELILGFESWKQTPLENRIALLTPQDIDLAAKIQVTADDPEPPVETDTE